jgi:hypothetical protein
MKERGSRDSRYIVQANGLLPQVATYIYSIYMLELDKSKVK